LGFYVALMIIMPLMMFKVSFDFFIRSILDDFNIILISGAEGVVGELKVVFEIGVKLVCDVEDVLVEGRAVNFFPMFIRFDMLEYLKNLHQGSPHTLIGTRCRNYS
jgi:hypothetical protein